MPFVDYPLAARPPAPCTGIFKEYFPNLPGMLLNVSIEDALNEYDLGHLDGPAFGIVEAMFERNITQKKFQVVVLVRAVPCRTRLLPPYMH